MHKCRYVDRLETEEGNLVRIVTALYENKRKTVYKKLDIYKEYVDKECVCRNLYTSNYCGLLVSFPGDKLPYGGGITELEDYGECAPKNFSSEYATDEELQTVLSLYPDFKYILKKCVLLRDEIIRTLRIWKEHKEVEFLLQAGLKNLAYSKAFYKLSQKKSKDIIKWCIRNKYFAYMYSLSDIQIMLKHNLSLSEYREFCRYKSECYTASMAYEDYLYLSAIKSDYPLRNYELYKDYKRMCKEAGHNIRDKYWKYPKDLRKAHDKVADEVMAIEKLKKEEQLKEYAEKYRKAVEKYIHNKGSYNGYDVYVADDISDWSIQADYLHQCIITAGYYNNVINGKELLVFIRKDNNPVATAQIYLGNMHVGQFYANELDRKNCLPSDDVKKSFNLWFEEFKKCRYPIYL